MRNPSLCMDLPCLSRTRWLKLWVSTECLLLRSLAREETFRTLSFMALEIPSLLELTVLSCSSLELLSTRMPQVMRNVWLQEAVEASQICLLELEVVLQTTLSLRSLTTILSTPMPLDTQTGKRKVLRSRTISTTSTCRQ
jgi:hypothetical protein